MAGSKDHWNAHAGAWQHLGPPLRPAPQDVAFFADAIRDVARAIAPEPLRIVLLGVTPELATLPLPAGSFLIAADRSDGMLAGVWPGDREGRSAVRAAWKALPLPDHCADVVMGDGCYTVLNRREDRDAVNAEICRVLRPGGRFIVRHFLRPQTPESPDAIFADLVAGRIKSFHSFKWRLAASLHGSLEDGLRVDDVWQAWASKVMNADQLARERDWPPPVVATIANYRGSEARYVLPTLAEARAEFSSRFTELDCRTATYELAPLFPTLSLSPINAQVESEDADLPSWSVSRSLGSAVRRRPQNQ